MFYSHVENLDYQHHFNKRRGERNANETKSLNPSTFYRSTCSKRGQWAVMNICVCGNDLASDSTIFRSAFGIILTVWCFSCYSRNSSATSLLTTRLMGEVGWIKMIITNGLLQLTIVDMWKVPGNLNIWDGYGCVDFAEFVYFCHRFQYLCTFLHILNHIMQKRT